MTHGLREHVAARLRDIHGVVENASGFGPGNAFWCNGREIAHFDADDFVDLRLTKPVIRELRPLLSADGRVEFRKGASDWIEVRVTTTDDIAFVAELAERAAAAHRPPGQEAPTLPPTDSDLARRRHFH